MLATLYGLSGLAWAHEPARDGTIVGLLHVSPDDKPVAGQASTVDIIMSDSSGRLKLADCECRVVIDEAGKPILDSSLTAIPGSATLRTSVTFPHRDVYNMVLTGEPTAAQAFPPFRLAYVLRVERGGKAASVPLGDIATYGLVAIAGLGVIWLTTQDILYGKVNHSRKGGQS